MTTTSSRCFSLTTLTTGAGFNSSSTMSSSSLSSSLLSLKTVESSESSMITSQDVFNGNVESVRIRGESETTFSFECFNNFLGEDCAGASIGGGGGGEDARGSGEAIGGGGVEIGDEEIGGGEGAGLGDAEEESGRHFAGTDKAEFHRGRIENGKGRGGKRKVWVGGWRVEIFGLKGEG